MVTIAVPTFGQSRYISQSIQSILSQSYTDIEIIIVPVRGDDGTRHEISKFKDGRIKIIESNYAMITHQMNLGFVNASGEYFIYFASDDIMSPNCIRDLVGFAELHSADVVYPDYSESDADLKSHKPKTFPEFSYNNLLKICYITDVSLMHRERMSKFFPMKFMDGKSRIYNVWKKAAIEPTYKIIHYPHDVFVYRQHRDAIHRNKSQGDYKCAIVGGNWNIPDLSQLFNKTTVSGGADKQYFTLYVVDPILLSGHESDVRFKRVIIHWDYTTVASIPLFCGSKNFYHVTTDAAVYELLNLNNIENRKLLRDSEVIPYLREDCY